MESNITTLTVQAHLVVTATMCGIIWWVQVVHYPMFSSIGAEEFVSYHTRNVQRTTMVVGPVMLAEAFLALALVYLLTGQNVLSFAWIGMGLLAVVWSTTAFFSVPAHGILSEGFDAAAHDRLVMTNWIRTLGWTSRLFIAWLIARAPSAIQ